MQGPLTCAGMANSNVRFLVSYLTKGSACLFSVQSASSLYSQLVLCAVSLFSVQSVCSLLVLCAVSLFSACSLCSQIVLCAVSLFSACSLCSQLVLCTVSLFSIRTVRLLFIQPFFLSVKSACSLSSQLLCSVSFFCVQSASCLYGFCCCWW